MIRESDPFSRGAAVVDSLGRKSQDSFEVQFAKSRSDDGLFLRDP